MKNSIPAVPVRTGFKYFYNIILRLNHQAKDKPRFSQSQFSKTQMKELFDFDPPTSFEPFLKCSRILKTCQEFEFDLLFLIF